MHMDEFDGNILSSMMQTIAHYTNPSSPVKEIGKLRYDWGKLIQIIQMLHFLMVLADIYSV